MAPQEVHERELAKWNAIAGVERPDETLRLIDADFHAHARRGRTTKGMSEFLGDLRGREVLELGCGMGTLSTLLAKSGARVWAFDLSPASVEVARRRAKLHGVADRVTFTVAAGEELPYEDERFDVTVGKAILHHLDVERAGPELHRVLRRGGRAAFSEPLGTNPALAFARDHLPYADKNPRGADRPLTSADLAAWTAPFRDVTVRELQLLTMLERVFGVRRPLRPLHRADERLLAACPGLRRLCRYVVITMVK